MYTISIQYILMVYIIIIYVMNQREKMKKKLIIIIGSIVLVYVCVFTFTTKGYERNNHQNAFRSSYHTTFEDPREQVIALALLAPSSHNMQPWKVSLDQDDPTKFTLYINPDRVLPVVDEQYNQMVISSGTFVSYAVEAGKELGYDVSYTVFPDGQLPQNPSDEELLETPIADVYVSVIESKTIETFDAIATATSKAVFETDEISSELLESIQNHSTDDVTVTVYTDQLDDIRNFLIEGVTIESQYKEAMLETSSIFRYHKGQKNDYQYGLSMNTSFSNSFLLANVEMINRLFPMNWEKEGAFWLENETKVINSCHTFAVFTGEDTRNNQFETGVLLGKIMIEMNQLDITVQPIVQITQNYDNMESIREQFNLQFGDGFSTHMIIKIGYTNQKNLHGMRLDVEDIIKN